MNKKGFTLMELLAVIALIGILGSVGFGVYTNVLNRSRQKVYESKVSQIETAAANF